MLVTQNRKRGEKGEKEGKMEKLSTRKRGLSTSYQHVTSNAMKKKRNKIDKS